MSSLRDVSHRIQDMQTLPQIALRLCQVTADEDCSVTDVASFLRLDPILAARLLHLVNSAYYGLRYPVQNLEKAVMVLGIKPLRNLVLLDALKGYFLSDITPSRLDKKQLWLHSAAVGIGAKHLCRRLLGQPGEDAFLAGLLHDIGILVEEQLDPSTFQMMIDTTQTESTSLEACERMYFGTDHSAIGYLLATTWSLPPIVADTIAAHHRTMGDEPIVNHPAAILQLAEYFATQADYGEGIGPPMEPTGNLCAYLTDHADELQVLFDDFVTEMQHAALLYEA